MQWEQMFRVESMNATDIYLRHNGEGHLYRFQIVEDDDGRRVFSTTYTQRGNPSAAHHPEDFLGDAVAYARQLAGRDGWVD